MTKLNSFLLLVTLSTFSFGQNSGYYGHKLLLTVKYNPIIDYRFHYADNIVPFKAKANFGFEARYIVHRRIAFGIEATQGYQTMMENRLSPRKGVFIDYYRENFDPTFDFDFNDYQEFSDPIANKYMIMPFIEFSEKNSLFSGSYHQKLGIRVFQATLYKSDYNLYSYDYGNVAVPYDVYYDLDEFEHWGFEIVYGGSYDIPITTHMSLKLGYNLKLGPFKKKIYSNTSNPTHIFESHDLLNEFQRNSFRNFLFFESGLTIAL